MTDRFHVDQYVGQVHDRTDRLANDAFVAVLRLLHTKGTVIATDPEERGAVPTIRHATLPGQYASVGVETYDVDRKHSQQQTTVCVTIQPGSQDSLRTSVRIIVNEPGSLIPDDASKRDIAKAVVEAAAVHLAQSINRRISLDPDLGRSEEHYGAELVYDLDPGDHGMADATDRASLATLNPNPEADAFLTMPTPWNPTAAFSISDHLIDLDPTLAARIPRMLRITTAYAFSDSTGRGRSATIDIGPVRDTARRVDPMERLRAMKDVRTA